MGGSGGGFFKESKPAKLIRDPKTRIKKALFLGPSTSRSPGAPDAPTFDAERDEELKQALIARLRQDFQRGRGRAATVATGQAGVTTPVTAVRKRARGV